MRPPEGGFLVYQLTFRVTDMSNDPSGSNTEDPLFNQARRIEHEMKAIMATQLRLAIAQVVLGIVGIAVAFLIASLG